MVRNIKWGMIAVGALMWACATDGQGNPGGTTLGNESPIGGGTEQPGGGATEKPTNTATENPSSCSLTAADALDILSSMCDRAEQCGWNETTQEPPVEDGTQQLNIDPHGSIIRLSSSILNLQALRGTSDATGFFGDSCESTDICDTHPVECGITTTEINGQQVCLGTLMACLQDIVNMLPCSGDPISSLGDFTLPASCEFFTVEQPPVDNSTGGGGPG
ncbi:MAG: hypothetical protein R3B07_00705 [Polyangiaceae bacterium]